MNYSKTLLSAIIAGLLLAGCNQAPPAPATDTTAQAPGADATQPAANDSTAQAPENSATDTSNETAPAPAEPPAQPAPVARQPAPSSPPAASAPPPRPTVVPPPRVVYPRPIVVPPPRVVYPGPGNRPPNPAADDDFYRNAISGGEKEVQMSRLALAHSRDPDVKRLANAMIRDHGALDARLTAASRMRDVPPGSGSALRELGTLFGPQFDNRYLTMMLADHRDAIALFNNTSRNGRTGAARNLAANALPTLRGHLANIQRTLASTQHTPAQDPPPRNHPHR